jgi:hypothetical protein
MVIALVHPPPHKEHLMRRTNLKYTLTAALAASALAATPALAKPIDGPIDGSNRYESQTGSLAGTTDKTPKQDFRGERAKDSAFQVAQEEKLQPGQPVFPTYHDPLPPRSLNASAPATNDDGSDVGVWLLVLTGVAGAGLVGGGAAGIARRTRLRARRVAV